MMNHLNYKKVVMKLLSILTFTICLPCAALAEVPCGYPAEVDKIVQSLRPAMTSEETFSIVKTYFPAAEFREGPWSGWSGAWRFMLTNRFELQLSAVSRDYKNTTHLLSQSPQIRIWDKSIQKHCKLQD